AETNSIESTAGNAGAGLWTAPQFRSNAGARPVLILLLAFNRPIDLLTSQKIDAHAALYQGNTKEFHHFFPRDYLVKTQKVPTRQANLLANFVMLTAASNKKITNRAPSDYLKEVESAMGSQLQTALDATLISPAAFAAAKSD